MSRVIQLGGFFSVFRVFERLFSAVAIALIALYQWIASPVIHLLAGGPRCRFYPTCSEYAKDAIIKHGLFRGVWLGSGRFLRCHPLAKGGVDPVPDRSRLGCSDGAVYDGTHPQMDRDISLRERQID